MFAASDADAIGEGALGWLDDALAMVKARLPPERPTGCAEGCAYCCHLKVLVSPSEAIHLGRHLRATRTADELSSLRARLASADQKTRGLGTRERAALQLACPLLVDGRCSAYEARPLHCAGANAYDPRDCARAFASPEVDVPVAFYVPQAQLADVITAGISRASFRTGHVGAMLELIAALSLVLEDPSREEAWLRGEDAFAEARDAELEALLREAGPGG